MYAKIAHVRRLIDKLWRILTVVFVRLRSSLTYLLTYVTYFDFLASFLRPLDRHFRHRVRLLVVGSVTSDESHQVIPA